MPTLCPRAVWARDVRRINLHKGVVMLDITQVILDIIGDEEYPAGWIVEELYKTGLPHGYPAWEAIKSLAHTDILDVRMGSFTYMVRKHKET